MFVSQLDRQWLQTPFSLQGFQVRSPDQLQQLARFCRHEARIGGNQFALILPGIMNQGHAVLAAARLFRMLEAPIELCGHKAQPSGSAGIAVSPNHSSNFDRLFAHAKWAMRRARKAEERYRVSDAEEDEPDDSAVSLEFELESAFAPGDLRMFFQPKIQMNNRRPVGADALMRWQSGIWSFVPPEQFVAAGERAGLINRMTQRAPNVSLQFSKQWSDRSGPQAVAVSLSPTLMADPILIDMISNCLDVWEVPGGALVLKVTKSSARAGGAGRPGNQLQEVCGPGGA